MYLSTIHKTIIVIGHTIVKKAVRPLCGSASFWTEYLFGSRGSSVTVKTKANIEWMGFIACKIQNFINHCCKNHRPGLCMYSHNLCRMSIC